MRYVDPNGEDAFDIAAGAVTTFGSNLQFGINRPVAYNSDFALGQAIGDVASVGAGLYETVVGGTVAAGGGALTVSVAGAAVGVPAAAVGSAVAAHGVGISSSGLIHLSQNKSAAEMAADLAGRIGKNSVPFETPTTKGHIDLKGKAHFDKATGQEIPTPHVQTRPKHVGPQGQVNLGPQTTEPATKADIRTAEKLVERRQ